MRVSDLNTGLSSWFELMADAVLSGATEIGLPKLLMYYPDAKFNPFQQLLYSQASEYNFATIPVNSFDEVSRFSWGGESVLHIHWLAGILRGAKNDFELESRIENFEKKLEGCCEKGHRLVWTMHNVLPHDIQNEEAEIRLRKIVCRLADFIHILARGSSSAASVHYELPEHKLRYLPHPSYQNWYPDLVSASNARAELGILPGETVYLFFGSIQRYKGVSGLIQTYKEMTDEFTSNKTKLLIVGKPVDKEYLNELYELAQGNPAIEIYPTAVSDSLLQYYFKAADVLVAPYEHLLNSGIALLATGFGVPIIAPNTGAVAEMFSKDPSLLYDYKKPLKECMLAAIDQNYKRSILDNINKEAKYDKVSSGFFDLLEEIISGE